MRDIDTLIPKHIILAVWIDITSDNNNPQPAVMIPSSCVRFLSVQFFEQAQTSQNKC